jgi:hypothetical protein
MANTYVALATTTLNATASSFTFSSIPTIYQDLVLFGSLRVSEATAFTSTTWTYNADTGNNYNSFRLHGVDSSVTIEKTTSTSKAYYFFVNGDSASSNAFSGVHMYIPAYRAASNKVAFTTYGAVQDSTSTVTGFATQGWLNTAAITSITMTPQTGHFMVGSSLSLYGISKTV